VAVAGSIASPLGAEVTLAAMLPSADLDPNAIKSAFSYLDRVARELARAGVKVGTQVRTGRIADGVLSGVELVAADLLVVATCLEDVFAIAERSRVPVVLVPPQIRSSVRCGKRLQRLFFDDVACFICLP
jgi:hypothetical protein